MPAQRRKRISTLPNLAKPRAGPSSAQRSSSKPQRRASQALDGSASLQKDSSPSEKTNVERSPKSPILPEKKTPVPQVPQFSPFKKSANKEQNVGVAAQKNDDTLQKNVPSPLKERPTQERSVAQEEKLPTKPTPVKAKQMCSDRERILKARKLREMLKEELKKERMKQLKHRPPITEGRSPPDRSKMTMRDLIYYLPENNPMKSSLAEEKRTERNSGLGQMKEQEEKSTPDHEEEDEEEEEENGEESQDGPLLVPRVKVAEDGSIILDEESLTVEVLRTKGPCVVEENEPIFERGSTTTYSSFRKSFYTKPWSNKETDMFFLAISMVGTDFSLIGQLFPHRARAEIKNKFKREEKANGWRIDKAFKEKRPFDFEFFAQLLEKVLADEEKRKQKTVKSQKPKEKRPSRPRKKPKAKAASAEAASDQDNSQKATVSDAETEADAVMAEKENEESLGVSEQTEEQVALEPALAKKKRKRRRKDELEEEVENLPEEMAVPSKIAVEGKSSKKREELDSATEEKQDETAVVEEEKSESCLPVDSVTEGESDLNLCSFQDGNDSMLETESAKLRMLDIRDEVPQESQVSKFPVSKLKNKERQSEETAEAKDKDIYDSCKPDEKENASDSDFQSEIMEAEKPAPKGRFQRPKPNLAKSSGRREAATQEKLEAETSSPKLVNEAEKCTVEESGSNRSEITEVENVDLETKSEEPEKKVIAKTVVRGCRQRFKPNITRASGKKEEPEKGAGKDKMSHVEPKRETEKNTDQSNGYDTTSGGSAGKHDKVLETVSQSNERAGLQEDSKQTVLKPAPLKRGRMPRPKPNIGRTTARPEVQTQKKDAEEGKTEYGEMEKDVTLPRNEKNVSCLKNDVMDYEDAQPCTVILEEDVCADSERMGSIRASQCSPQKSSAESCECEEESSDVLNEVSDFSIEESGPQKQEEKTIVSSARLLRSRFQRPRPNLGKITGRKDVLDVNKGVSQADTNKEESLTQCDRECSTLPDADKTEKYEVLQSFESLGKENSLGFQEASGRPSHQSLEMLSRSEEGELKSCPPVHNQEETSATDAGFDSRNTTQEESKSASLQPVQLVRGRFQRHKPNFRSTVGRKELQTEKHEWDKKPEAEQLVLQKDESANAVSVVGENEIILHQADVLSDEEQAQQEEPRVPHISENVLRKQSSAEKSIFPEGKLAALKPAQLLRNRFQRARPNLGRACSKKESLVVQKLAAPVEEEAEKGESLPVVEESEEPLSSQDDMEALLPVGNSAKNDSPETNTRSMRSEILCSPEKSPDCPDEREQKEYLSTEAVGSIQDTPERSSDKFSSGEKSESSDTKALHQVRGPLWKPKSNLMRGTRKRDDSEEGGSRNEDSSAIRNAEECLVSGKTDVSMQNSSNLVEAASSSEATRKHPFTDSEETFCKRIKQDGRFQSPEISSESESQEEDSQPSTSQEKTSDHLTRRQSRRSSKRIASKQVSELRTASSSASECEPDRSEKGNQRQKNKLNITKGKSLKSAHRGKSGKEHRSSKTTLVTLRASQEEEEDEADDFEPDDEDQCFAPEEVNKAPVFVPVGLRSPKPVPVQIEETMEELEISANVPDVQVVTDFESLSHVSLQPVMQREENVNTSPAEANMPENPKEDKGLNDGSTEAAMTLLAMGDPTFQLKINTEERTQTLPAQDDLHVASNLVTRAYSEQSVISCQYLLSSPPSNTELIPSEDGSNINLEGQSTGTGTGGEGYFEKNTTDTSDSSMPMVNSLRLTRGRLLKPEPDFGVLRSNKNIIQKPVNANVLVEELEQVQSEATVLRDTAEMQKVELQQVRPAAGSSLDLHDFATGSMEPVKQVDKTERTEKEMRNACGTSEELKALTASPKPEASDLGQELYPNQSSVDGLPEQNPSPAEHNLYTINLTQSEACVQDFQQQYISSTEETSVVNDDRSRCPEEEQTFILTLVEIPADSREYHDASALLEQTSEPLLPAPILLSPINASGTSVTGAESTGSLTTSVAELAASLNSSIESKQLQSASVEPISSLVETTQKRSAAELEENDFPPAKKILSTLGVGNLESTYKDYSTKSTNPPRRAAENLFEKAGASAKKKVLSSAVVSEPASLLAERSQSETLQNSGTASLENSTSKQEGEVISRLTSERKAEISGQRKLVDVHESGQLEHTGSLAASSKTPLLRGGRKPLGFLSLICKKSSSESPEDTKGNRGKVQKPRIVTPKRSLKKPTLSNEDGRESCSLPSTSTSSVDCESIAADAAVKVPSDERAEKPSLCAKDQEKEEEPTRISEYFFSDIFMEVDDSE